MTTNSSTKTRKFVTRVTAVAASALIALTGAVATSSPAAAQTINHRTCSFRLQVNAARTQSIADMVSCTGGMQVRSTITFRPDGGSAGMTLTHVGGWAGTGMVSVATRTIANHHFVSHGWGWR